MKRLLFSVLLLLCANPAWGAGAFAQVANATVTATTCAVTLNGTTAGNALVFVDNINSVTLTDGTPSGGGTWTLGRGPDPVGTNQRSYSWVAPNIAGGNVTTTVTHSGSVFARCFLAEISGIATSSPIDGSGAANVSTSPMDSGPLTTTATDFIVGYGGNMIANDTFTAGTGFTIPTNGQAKGGGSANFIEGKAGVAADSPHATATDSNTGPGNLMAGIALKESGGGPPPCANSIALMGVGCR